MSSGDFTLDPDANLDFQVDWTAWLAPNTDTITSHSVTLTNGTSGFATIGTVTATTTTVTAWLSAATLNETLYLTCHIGTAQGRSDDRTLRIFVTNR